MLLFLLLLIHSLGGTAALSLPEKPCPGKKVFVQVSGNVKHPGVYGFEHPPCLAELVDRAGGLVPVGAGGEFPDCPVAPGRQVVITCALEQVGVSSGELSPFFRLTLGMPISINGDTALGLTALSGIGPKTAAAIVRARERKDGFLELEDLMSIRGISPSLYRKIRPYLVL